MPTPRELTADLWDGLDSERTMMIGLDGVEDGHARPMTAQFDGADRQHIYFFTSKDKAIVRKLAHGNRAIATFTSRNHKLFATVHGSLSVHNDRATIDRLWNGFVGAWFEGGQDDPKLALLQLSTESAEIWQDASSLIAGIKATLGIDPKEDYKDKVAEVKLG